ncbi:MAG: PilZ domain-containing protein [Myxococcota bacterium]
MTVASTDRELTRFVAETITERSLDGFVPRPEDPWSIGRAHSSLEALVLLTGVSHPPDLLLVDTQMGDMMELLDRLQGETGQMPLVAVITERGRDLTLRRRIVQRYGVAGFLEHPLRKDGLHGLMARLDRRRRVLVVGPKDPDSEARVRALTDAGHQVEHKGSAEDGWAGLDAFKPDLLVGSLRSNGGQLCVECKSSDKWSDLPALLYGRFDELPARPLSENAHRADDFISTEESLARFTLRVAALIGSGQVLRRDDGRPLARSSSRTTSTMPKAAAASSPQLAPTPATRSPSRRLTRRVPITVTVDLIDEERRLSSETLDISEGGIFVAAETPPPIGSKVKVEFTVPGHGPVRAVAKVAWTSGTGMGLRFKVIEGPDLEAVVDYVNRVARVLYTTS